MLSITILKVSHDGEKEARRVLEYVKSCGVISQEAAYRLSTESFFYETEWRKVLESGMSRSEFLRKWDDAQRDMPANIVSEGTKQFNRKLAEYIFLNKKPIYHSERWPDVASIADVKNRYQKGRERFNSSIDLVSSGQESAVQDAYRALQIYVGALADRDKNMAANLAHDVAEPLIRQVYPSIKNREIIKLTAEMGFFHTPEVFMAFKPTVIELPPSHRDQYDALLDKIEKLCYEGTAIDALTPLLVELSKIKRTK